MRIGGLGRGRSLGPAAEAPGTEGPQVVRSFRLRADSRPLITAALAETGPLPPLRPAPERDRATEAPAPPDGPSWSPLAVALWLFVGVWGCFALLGVTSDAPSAARWAGLDQVLAIGAGVVALVLVTLSVAHAQISGRGPRPAMLGVAALGLGQGAVAATLSSGGHVDLWGVAGWAFVLVGVAVPLAGVGSQFQRGVRRQRLERHDSLIASWIERARWQANQTVQSVHRHDVRSMLFVIDGAARTLADGSLTADQRASFGEMLKEGVQRLGALVDVRSGEIQPFAVDGVARAVVHAERKAGRKIGAELPAGLVALGGAADVAAVLRTLVTLTATKSAAGVQIRADHCDAAIVVRIEPADTVAPLPLLIGNWEQVWAESSKPFRQNDDESVDLYVAARLLAEQGADLWSTAERAGFAVRLPVAADPTPREGA
jgi:hypothetical protein